MESKPSVDPVQSSKQEYPSAKKEATHSLRSSRTSEADRATKIICFGFGVSGVLAQACARSPSATDFLKHFNGHRARLTQYLGLQLARESDMDDERMTASAKINHKCCAVLAASSA